MSERSTARLIVFGVLVMSLFLTLSGRLFELQVVRAEEYQTRAVDNRTREVITTPPRGLILDQVGRPLVSNRSSLVVTVDRTVIDKLDDDGAQVFQRLAELLGIEAESIRDRIRPCGTPGAELPPICWNGSPVQPVPVARDVSYDIALAILEQPLRYPGVTASVEQVRDYPAPYGVNAAHIVGYLGPVSEADLERQSQLPPDQQTLRRTDLIGRAGLESVYDRFLRGIPGVRTLTVDKLSNVVGVASEVPATPGNHLLTSIDARLQAVVEQQLSEAITRARGTIDRTSGTTYTADSGAAIVMDVTNGRILAMASYPTYDPRIWEGGITSRQYQRLIDKDAGEPLLFRPTQGLYPPGSTFKVISTATALTSGWAANSTIACPSTLNVAGRTMRNFESRPYGPISLAQALEVSCNTVYYKVAYDLWLRDGGITPIAKPEQRMYRMAKRFGLGRTTGIDLPRESRGRIVGRQERIDSYLANRDVWCERGRTGYPDVAKDDPEWAAYLKAIAQENCVDGDKYRGGDAALFAIGQGDTVVTPLQMAVAYAAIANGGTMWQPQIAKAVLSPTGSVIREFAPVKTGQLRLPRGVLPYIRSGLEKVVTTGSAAWRFVGFPLDQVQVAGKTGTAQMSGSLDDTSWFVSYAPANKPKYLVLMMVSQGGTGSGTSAPSVRAIYEALYGIEAAQVSPARSVLAGGSPSSTVPAFRGDGTPLTPELLAEGLER